MTKYRIINKHGKYFPQVKGWFFWSNLVDFEAFMYGGGFAGFDRIEAARAGINNYHAYYSNKPSVIEEFQL